MSLLDLNATELVALRERRANIRRYIADGADDEPAEWRLAFDRSIIAVPVMNGIETNPTEDC